MRLLAVAWAAWLLMAAGAGICADAERTPRPVRSFDWAAGAGCADYLAPVRGDRWLPVWIRVRAGTEGIDGRIVIWQQDNPFQVEVEVKNAPGVTKLYRTYYRMLQGELGDRGLYQVPSLKMLLLQDGEPALPLELPLRFAEKEERLILALAEEPARFRILDRRATEVEMVARLGEFDRRMVIQGNVALLPDDAQGLETYDTIILDGEPIGRVTEAQWRAIRGWVARGGTLLVGAGRHATIIRESELANLFGVDLAEPEEFAPPEGAGTPPGTPNPLLVTWPAADWDEIWAGRPDRPLLAGKRIGAGWFCLSSAALDQPWLEALNRPWGQRAAGRPFDSLKPLLNGDSYSLSPLHSAGNAADGAINQSLQDTFVTGLADVEWVLWYLLAWNAMMLPANWWIWRRLKRPEWSWATLAPLALGFAFFAWHEGMSRQRQNMQVNELVLAVGVPEAGVAVTKAWTFVFVPTLTERLPESAGRVFPSQVEAAGTVEMETGIFGGEEAAGGTIVSFDRTTGFPGLTLRPWTGAAIESEFVAPFEGGITAAVSAGTLTLTNGTAIDFARWWIGPPRGLGSGGGVFRAGASVTAASPAFGAGPPNTEFDLSEPITEALQHFRTEAPPFTQVFGHLPLGERSYLFIGEAEAPATPLAVPYGHVPRIGRMIYVQELDLPADAPRPNRFDAPWRVIPLLVGKEAATNAGLGPVAASSPSEDTAVSEAMPISQPEWPVLLPLNVVTLRLQSAEPLPPSASEVLLHLSATLPGFSGSQDWERQKGKTFAGLRVEALNNLGQWVPVGTALDDPLALPQPPGQFFNYDSIVIRLLAQPDELLYSPISFGIGIKQDRIWTGAELFGPQPPRQDVPPRRSGGMTEPELLELSRCRVEVRLDGATAGEAR